MWENKKNIDDQKTKTKKHIYNIITIAPNYLHEVPDISWIFQVQYCWNIYIKKLFSKSDYT